MSPTLKAHHTVRQRLQSTINTSSFVVLSYFNIITYAGWCRLSKSNTQSDLVGSKLANDTDTDTDTDTDFLNQVLTGMKLLMGFSRTRAVIQTIPHTHTHTQKNALLCKEEDNTFHNKQGLGQFEYVNPFDDLTLCLTEVIFSIRNIREDGNIHNPPMCHCHVRARR
jgi:hypothetical protein